MSESRCRGGLAKLPPSRAAPAPFRPLEKFQLLTSGGGGGRGGGGGATHAYAEIKHCSNNNLGREGCHALCPVLPQLPNISVLDLRSAPVAPPLLSHRPAPYGKGDCAWCQQTTAANSRRPRQHC